MFQYLLKNLTPVVKNLVIINAVFYIAQLLYPSFTEQFALYYFESDKFKFYQIATHFFMHAPSSFLHILFNMFALIMFGPPLERIWNAQKFLLFYFISALGALFLHQAVMYFQVQELNELLMAYEEGSIEYYETIRKIQSIAFTPMLGASGAIFGVLAAFAFYFPNTQLMLLFPPIPIKAKWLVLILVGFDLFMGLGSTGSNVAHFAHLGGALFGFIMVLLWQKNRTDFY